MGKSRLAKVIFINIHKIGDVCLVDTSWLQMYEKCFYFLSNSHFSRKVVFQRKLKSIYPSTPRISPTFLILFKKLLAPPPFKKECRNYILYERLQRRDIKVISILYDRFFIHRTVKS